MPHWKLLIVPLVVIVPLLAYVAGTVAAGPEGPTRQEPIVLRDAGETTGAGDTRDGRREDRRDDRREDRRDDRGDDRRDERGRGEEDGDDSDGFEQDDHGDDDVRVVAPEPTGVDDDDGGGDDGGDDHGDDADDGDDDRDHDGGDD